MSRQRKIPILVVEDDQDVGEVVCLFMQERGFDPILVTTSRGGYEAFMEEKRIRVVLFDNTLGHVWGRKFHESVREEGRRRGAAFILMTGGDVRPKDALYFKEEGVVTLTKPFSPAEEDLLPALLTAVAKVPPDRDELGPPLSRK